MAGLDIGVLSDIPRLGARVVETKNGRIAVFRTRDDQVFAVRDACPHKGGPLSQGLVSGTVVACPLHNWRIDLASGQALGADEGCVNTFTVEMRAGRLVLTL